MPGVLGFGLRRHSRNAVTAVPTPEAPVNTNAPYITGTPRAGYSLTVVQGVYTGIVTSISDQWTRNSSDVPGQIGAGYLLTAADVAQMIGLNEIAYNVSVPSATQSAVQVGPILSAIAPTNDTLPTFSYTGPLQPGTTVTLLPGAWTADPAPSYGYAIKVNGGTVATGNSYTLQAGDASGSLTGTVTATNAGGSASATSSGVSIGAVTGLDLSVPAPSVAFAAGTTNTTYPPAFSVGLPAEFKADVHTLVRQYAADAAFTSPTSASLTVSDAQAAAFTKVDSGLASITSGVHYVRYRIEWNAGANLSAWSNIQGHGSTAAPAISTAATATNTEGNTLALALTADEPCQWVITSGVDMDQFQIGGTQFVAPVLQWFNNGTQTFGSGADAVNVGGPNTYTVTLTATDYFGNTATLTETVTVTSSGFVAPALKFNRASNSQYVAALAA